MAISNFIPTVWSETLAKELEKQYIAVRNCNRDFEGDIKCMGDSVKIIDGALASFIGTVEELDKERGKVRVVVSMFGRETPVELELDQVETI